MSAWQWLRDFVLGDGLTPHGFCLLWEPSLLTWTIIGDGTVALAYVLIPLAILVEVRRRRLLMPAWVFCLFAAFILLCGLSHVLMIWTLFHPAYWLEACTKVATGIVSLFTAGLLPFARPKTNPLWHEANRRGQLIVALCQRHGEPVPADLLREMERP